jgi:hypothetical protein
MLPIPIRGTAEHIYLLEADSNREISAPAIGRLIVCRLHNSLLSQRVATSTALCVSFSASFWKRIGCVEDEMIQSSRDWSKPSAI